MVDPRTLNYRLHELCSHRDCITTIQGVDYMLKGCSKVPKYKIQKQQKTKIQLEIRNNKSFYVSPNKIKKHRRKRHKGSKLPQLGLYDSKDWP